MTRDKSVRLGRGLAALLGEPEAAAPSGEIRTIPVARLDPNPHQPRAQIDPEFLRDLVHSIRSPGILQPLLVRPSQTSRERFEIVAGERRWRAATEAGLRDVPCLMQEMDNQQSAVAALVENLQRLDLNPLEEAQGFERLVEDFHLTQEALAEVVGKSRSHVANTLRLLKLPEKLQIMVRNGELSAGHARALLTHPNPLEAARQIVEGQLSVRQAEALAEKASAPQPPRPDGDRDAPLPDPDLLAVERDLAEQLGMTVKLRANGGRGSLTLRFSRLEQLDYVISRLGQSRLD